MAKPKGRSTAQVTSNDPAQAHKESIVAKIQAHKQSGSPRAKGSFDAKKRHKEGISADVAKYKAGAKDAIAQHKASVQAAIHAHKGIEVQQENVDQTEKQETQLSLETLADRVEKLEAEGEFAIDRAEQIETDLGALEDKLNEYKPVDEEDPERLGPEEFALAETPFANSQFYTAQKAGTDYTITINAGRLIRGSSSTEVAGLEFTFTSGTQTYYVYLESWYNAGLKQQFVTSTAYPNQGSINDGGEFFRCERTLIATVVVLDTIMTVYPQRIGEIHSTRLWQ